MTAATLSPRDQAGKPVDPQWDGPAVGTLDALANIASECEEASRTERDIRRLEALAEIATWCQQQAERLADGDERQLDVASVAWEIGYRYGDRISAKTIVRLAYRRAGTGHQFDRSSVSIEDHAVRVEPEPGEDEVDIEALYHEGRASSHDGGRRSPYDPARIVGFKLDIGAWGESLDTWQRLMAAMLANGHSIGEVAGRFDVTRDHVYRLRRELWGAWVRFWGISRVRPETAQISA